MSEDLSIGRILSGKKYEGTGSSGSGRVERAERAEAAIGSYSVRGDSLLYIYSVPVTKNHRTSNQDVQFMNFPSRIFSNDINPGYRVAVLKKNSLWLLPFYMVVATFFYYEKVSRTIRLQLYQTSLIAPMIAR